MTTPSLADLLDEAGVQLPDNTAGAITPAKIRGLFQGILTAILSLAPEDVAGLAATLAAKADLVGGTIPLAQIPVLPSGVRVYSSGGLTDLTAGQKAAIGKGAIVITTDGRRSEYTGAGTRPTRRTTFSWPTSPRTGTPSTTGPRASRRPPIPTSPPTSRMAARSVARSSGRRPTPRSAPCSGW